MAREGRTLEVSSKRESGAAWACNLSLSAGSSPEGERSPSEARPLAALLSQCGTGLTITLTACCHLRLKGFHAFARLGIPPRSALLLLSLNQLFRLRDDLLRRELLRLTCNRHSPA
jgi:hypothetical protein